MNFFKIRLPGQAISSGCSDVIVEDVRKISIADSGLAANEGFIYSEFKENPEIFLIPASETHFSVTEADNWAYLNDVESSREFPFAEKSTSREEHISAIKQLRSKTIEWKSEGYRFTKAIASRVSRERCCLTPSEIFRRLCQSYPEACVFLFSTSRHGTWIGASPEIILTSSDNEINTVSLAGTRWNSDDRGLNNEEQYPQKEWDQKNIEEQQIVTDFIVEALKGSGLNPTSDGPDTLKAGPVEHLVTRIKAEGTIEDFSLLRHLCPTPALSGYPRQEAIQAITEIEHFPRLCYGGMIGLVKSNGDFFTYANLRSGRLDMPHKTIQLHAGGGITPLSDPESEWEETEKKLSTLRRFIR